MKKIAFTVLILTIAIFLISPSYIEARGGHGGYYGGSYWVWWWPWAVFGGAAALAPYYAPPPVVTQEQPPVYAQPAPSIPTSLSAEKIFVYPRKGQSEEQQAKDRNECNRWAVSQTHYDPTQPISGMPGVQLRQMHADYLRAMDACLDARGYTMR